MKVKKLSVFILSVILLSGSGCANRFGSKEICKFTVYDVESSIKDGKTKKEEIIEIFGKSFDITLDSSGRESWHYRFIKNYAGRLSLSAQLVLVFDENGVVEKHAFYSSRNVNFQKNI